MATRLIVVPTFDDTCSENRKAAGLLEKMGVRATFFLTTENLRQEDAAELGAFHEVGSHTDTHPRLTSLDPLAVMAEVTKSKRILENFLRREVVSFSHPYGKINGGTKKAVRAAGYAMARGVSIRAPVTEIGDSFNVPLAYSDLPLTNRSMRYHQLRSFVGGTPSFHYFRFWNNEVHTNPYAAFEGVSKLIVKEYADGIDPKIVVLLFHAGGIENKDGWEKLEKGLLNILTVGRSRTFGEMAALASTG